ncbi:MAG TPA: homocysteine S-methyltransferase family protein [Candidatus Acidoferrales bacterium]|nr:homocysteine S-methyltransferase family protein [Candidatus Acidoferrales bacterium]
MRAYERVRESLKQGRTILLDGGVGTEILRRGVYWRCHGMEQKPEAVEAVHSDYIAAGADVITTNTFQLTRRSYLNLYYSLDHMRRIGAPGLEHRAAELTAQAVALAQKARTKSKREVAIAGSVSPLNHCYRPDLVRPDDELRSGHAETTAQLAKAGVDLILLETMNTIREARVACEAARDTGLPVWLSFVVGADARLLSGEALADAVRAVEPLEPEVVLVNCGPPEDITAALTELRRHRKGLVGAYAHIGKYNPPSWKAGFYPGFSHTEAWPPARYAAVVEQWLEGGAQVVGGCCGTTPDHIRALHSLLADRQPIPA